MASQEPGDTTLLLHSLEPSGPADGAAWLPLVYDELRDLAASRMAREPEGHTLQATALVHEAWLRLSKHGDRPWRDRAHFFRVAARAMRRVLVEHARGKASLKRGAHAAIVPLDEATLHATSPDERILLVDHALGRLEAVDAEAAQIVTLKFFAGYTTAEIAEIMDLSIRSVERIWTHARARLMQLIREAP
ncbi:MAG: sigma-70 family RNA polymerase sigma factor [Opitutaceae bacterium]|nr:sigma-70 family RNA polymerase sigma factor [Opitutaceae bacterium]